MQSTPAPGPEHCSAFGCSAKLNRDNTTGRCPKHRYIPVADRAICAADGCEEPLRKDNRTGYCTPHKRAKNRGPVPKRDLSGRVYKDRNCADCGAVFTPASATQQRCPDCRPERRRALKRKQEWDICSVPGCDARLRTSNTTGRCSPHRNLAPRDVCAADGCGKRLRKDNRIGFCDEHRAARTREPARFCGAPGCDRRLRTDNTTGYCPDHAQPMWKEREYLDRRYARERAERASKLDGRRVCSVDGCERKLRSDNTLGRCSDHRYIPIDWAECSVDGCAARIKPGNPLGRCMEHRGAYWADDALKCSVPGCGKTLHADNKSGLCKRHYDEAWSQRNNRAYYLRNQADLREYARQYREVYAEEHRAAASAWNASNRAARFASEARRRLAAGTGMDDIDRMLSICYRLAIRKDPCFYCGSPDTDHVDHYFPLAKGGSDHWYNLVRSCDRCNNAKYVMCGTAFLLLPVLSGG